MNISIPTVICLDCKKDMATVEGTNQRVCHLCDKQITIKVIEE